MQSSYQKLLFLFFLTALVLPVWAKQPAIAPASPVVILFSFVVDNPDFFELTPEQKKQVAMVGQESGNKREGLDQLIIDLRTELREEVLKSPMNQKLVNDLRDDLLVQEKARLQLSIDCAQGLQKALTKAQWQTLLELSTQ